jgi:hypothetical protein
MFSLQFMFSGRWQRRVQQHGSVRGVVKAMLASVWEQFLSYVSHTMLAAKVLPWFQDKCIPERFTHMCAWYF